MSITQHTPGGDKTPQESAHNALATLRAAARDSQVTRAALAVLIELHTPTNAWRAFTVTALASALLLSRETITRALRVLARRGYLEERNVHRAHGEREARLTPLPVPTGAPGATR